MLEAGLLDGERAGQGYEAMKNDGSRLPWDKIGQQLKRYCQG